LIAWLSLSCCKKDDAPKAQVVTITDTTLTLKYGIPFHFKIQGSERVFSIKIKTVNEDRCFFSQCQVCFGSAANVIFDIQESCDTLKILGCLEQISKEQASFFIHSNFKVSLLGLFPYPSENNSPIAIENYSTLINIQRL
jgi:hypothetical protein